MLKKKDTVGELIFGIHPLLEALKAKKRKCITIYTTKPHPKGWDMVEPLLPAYKIPVQYVTRDVLTRMVQTPDHQGFVAWMQPFPLRKKMFDPKSQPFLVLLDGIQDPRNVGAILRSCYCTGVDGVILVKKNAAPLNAVALKSSAGLAEHLDIIVLASVEEAVLQLKKAGYTLYMAAFDGKNAVECEYQMPLCLVIGSEGVGISRSILHEGIKITLPQRSPDISYNASVAASLLTFLIGTRYKKI